MKVIVNWRLRRKLLAGFGLVLSLVTIQSVIAFRVTKSNADAAQWVDHTYQVIGVAGDALAALVDMETGYRGFLVTGREVFLEPYISGQARATAALAQLATLTADNPTQVERWKDLTARAQAWRAEITTPGIELRRRVDSGAATQQDVVAFETSGEGKRHFDGMRSVFAAAIGAERQLMTSRSAAAGSSTRSLLVTLVGGTLVVVLLGLTIAYAVARSITRPLTEVSERAERLQSVCIAKLEQALSAMAAGDLSVNCETSTKPLMYDRKDEIGDLARTVDSIVSKVQASTASFTNMRQTVRSLIAETEKLTAAAKDGALETRGDARQFTGAYHDLVGGFNNTLDLVLDPIKEAAGVMERVANRDMTARVTGEYKGDHAKIKTALNTVVENLQHALSEINGASEQVAAAADQIAQSSQVLAQGASEQASTIEEVSSSLQEITSMSQTSAASAKEAKSLAEAAKMGTEQGGERMAELAAAMGQLKTSSDQTAKIVRTIDEIAFQTNLLALNAAVEAARAGDAGKGFAVVADEVRALSMRAADAAKQTASLIEETVQHTARGVTMTTDVQETFFDIATRTNRVREVMAEMAAAAEQQMVGIAQVKTAVEQMSAVTQQSAAGSEETASAAEELTSQAMQMNGLVGQFNLTTSKHGSHMAAPVRAPAPQRPPSVIAKGSRPASNARRNGNGRSGVPQAAAHAIPFGGDESVASEF